MKCLSEMGYKLGIIITKTCFILVTTCTMSSKDSVETISYNLENLPYTFVLQDSLLKSEIDQAEYYVDLDNDNIDERIQIIHPKPSVYSIFIRTYGVQLNFNNPIQQNLYFFDANDDNLKDIFVVEQLVNSRIISIMSTNEDTLFQFIAVNRDTLVNNREWDCNVIFWGYYDLNGDDFKDLIFATITGYAHYPRGIYAYDLKNKNYLFKVSTGGPPFGNFNFTQLVSYQYTHFFYNEFIDINKDNKPDLIFATSAPKNGVIGSGMSDDQIWIFRLDKQGNFLWKKALCEEDNKVTRWNLYPLKRSGQGDYLFVELQYEEPYRNAQIFIFEGENGESLDSIQVGATLLSTYVADLDFDGNSEIILFFSDGKIKLYNNLLEEKISVKYEGNYFYPILHTDLLETGTMQLMMLDSKQRLLILDNELKPIAYGLAFLGKVQLRHKSHNRKPEIVYTKDGRHNRSYQLVKTEKKLITLYLVLFSFIVILTIVFLKIFIDYILFMKQIVVNVLKIGNTGMIFINSTGRIKSMNENSKKLLFLKKTNIKNKNFSEIFNSSDLIQLRELIEYTFQRKEKSITELSLSGEMETKHLEISLHPIVLLFKKYKGVLVLIRDVSKIIQLERMKNWASLVRKITHDIRSPLAVILLSIQKLQYRYKELKFPEEKEFDGYVNNACEETIRIQDLTKSFLKFTNLEQPNLEPVKINKLMEQLLIDFSGHLDGKIKLEKRFDSDLQFALADEIQLNIAFRNIIDNALHAMKGSGDLQINIQQIENVSNENFILIEIIDNGQGIDAENILKIFEPYFTTREEGTGFGLTITKKIVEDHHGTIDVKSTLNIGTTISIQIPAYQETKENISNE